MFLQNPKAYKNRRSKINSLKPLPACICFCYTEKIVPPLKAKSIDNYTKKQNDCILRV
jgi:hypothetical protein